MMAGENMRRHDREITDSKLIEDFIGNEQILRLAFSDDGDIYIVPVNYGFCCTGGKYSFYFHGAKQGRKYELAKSSPLVGFEIDGKYRLISGENACSFSAEFQSVIGTGTLHIVSSSEEKRQGLDMIMKQVTHSSQWTYSEKMLEAVAVFRLDAVNLSCKANQIK